MPMSGLISAVGWVTMAPQTQWLISTPRGIQTLITIFTSSHQTARPGCMTAWTGSLNEKAWTPGLSKTDIFSLTGVAKASSRPSTPLLCHSNIFWVPETGVITKLRPSSVFLHCPHSGIRMTTTGIRVKP